MVNEKTGSLTKTQIEVLRLRIAGLTQEEAANRLGTTRQNVSLVERRAKNNLRKAEETIAAYRKLRMVASVIIPSSTHMVDVPRLLVNAADSAGVKISGDFSLVYKELKHNAGNSISGSRIIKPIKVDILKDGDIFVEPS